MAQENYGKMATVKFNHRNLSLGIILKIFLNFSIVYAFDLSETRKRYQKAENSMATIRF